MRNKIIKYFLVGLLGVFNSCDFLNVVPDNIATIDNAFVNRNMAEKYLFTCYSYMPSHGDLNSQAFLVSDEFWCPYPQHSLYFWNIPFQEIARGNQGMVDPALDYWRGSKGGKPMFKGLRDCNIFLERLNEHIPALQEFEKKRWIAEVKFLKAYYHYWLLRMYGPIPLIKENLPISANVEEVKVYREPVDDCFDYIVNLLDEAIIDLPLILQSDATENGRATKPMALALKAKVLVEAASPLFNGNMDYASFKRNDDIQYFNQIYDVTKWEKAALACRNAIDTCHLAGFALHYYEPGSNEKLPPEMITQMSIRTSVTEGNYDLNNEIVWNNPMSDSNSLQERCLPYLSQSHMGSDQHVPPVLGIPLKIVEMFYSNHGVPINEDKEWDSSGQYINRYSVKTGTDDNKYNIQVGYQTAIMHFNREPRFYANLTFDGNLWYGVSNYDINNQYIIQTKLGDFAGKRNSFEYSVTGYYCKKLVNHRDVVSPRGYTKINYNWPVLRLADLYLLCSEATNEAYGPLHEDACRWIDLVRKRAGLEDVKSSWAKYANAPFQNKPTTQEGLREIIQNERLIELANEGHRFWEIRRWKRGREIWNQPIQGWDINQTETDTYYRVRTIFTPQFSNKDYFWPISEYDLSVNTNLDQNPGWD